MAKKRKRKKGRKKIILFVFEIILLLVVLGALALYNSTIGKIDFKKQLTTSEAGVNDDKMRLFKQCMDTLMLHCLVLIQESQGIIQNLIQIV